MFTSFNRTIAQTEDDEEEEEQKERKESQIAMNFSQKPEVNFYVNAN